MISLSPTPVKRPFHHDEDGDVNMNSQEEEHYNMEFSGHKRTKRVPHLDDCRTNSIASNDLTDPVSVSNNPFLGSTFQSFPSSSSSSSVSQSSASFFAQLANEENQSPMKTNSNRFSFTDVRLKDKRLRLDESIDRAGVGGIPIFGSGSESRENKNNKAPCNSSNDNGDCKSGSSCSMMMSLNPAHMQSMYENQLANNRKEMAEKNAEVQSSRIKIQALTEDNKILKKAVNIQESRQRELTSYNQQLELTLGQAVEHIASLEKAILSLKSQLLINGGVGSGPYYHLDQPPPDVY